MKPSKLTARLASRIALDAVSRLPLEKAATLSEPGRFSLAAEVARQLYASPAFRQLAAAEAELPALRKQVKGFEARFGNLEDGLKGPEDGASSPGLPWRDRFTPPSGPRGLIPLTPDEFRVTLARQDPPRPGTAPVYAMRPEEAS